MISQSVLDELSRERAFHQYIVDACDTALAALRGSAAPPKNKGGRPRALPATVTEAASRNDNDVDRASHRARVQADIEGDTAPTPLARAREWPLSDVNKDVPAPTPTAPPKAGVGGEPGKSSRYREVILGFLPKTDLHAADSGAIRNYVARTCGIDRKKEPHFAQDVMNALMSLKASGRVTRKGMMWSLLK